MSRLSNRAREELIEELTKQFIETEKTWAMQRQKPKWTLLYLSGSSFRGENYVMKHREELPHVGILLSYNDLRKRGSTMKRLDDLRGK